MFELSFLFLSSEDEYYEKFCEIYKEEIITPDGFCVVCKFPKERARHICGGGSHKFQKDRAGRIGWPKHILLNPENRVILFDTQTKNLVFFFEKNRTSYVVICSEMKDGKFNLISGFLVSGNRAKKYKEAKPPYKFYNKKSC